MSRKTEGVLMSTVAQRNPEDTPLSEINQSSKTNTTGGKIAQKLRALAALEMTRTRFPVPTG